MTIVFLLAVVLGLAVVAALVAVETDDVLSAVIALGALGFFVSTGFLLLCAPDLAITQVVVEVLTLVVLIRATIARGVKTVGGGGDLFGRALALVALLIVFLVSYEVLKQLPPFGEPAALAGGTGTPSLFYLMHGLERTGAANHVTAVILDFRAYDTLGEATVIFTAVLGATAVLRRKARKRAEEPEEDAP
ncbi:MAG: DUF4040 domain-containing protein [Planctomycetes bacterium]|nr:DUF4040 domain-containing protein [Planctomycetota bacterium]